MFFDVCLLRSVLLVHELTFFAANLFFLRDRREYNIMKWENLRPLSPMFCDDMLDDYVDSKIAYEAWDGPVRRAVRLGCVGVTKQDIASFVISNAWRRSRLRHVFSSIERLHAGSLHAFITGHLNQDRLAGEKFRCKYPNKSCGLGMSAVKQWNLE